MGADIALGVTLDDSEYYERCDRADKRLEKLGSHDFSRSQRGARLLGREVENVGKTADATAGKLSRMQRFTERAEKLSGAAGKVKWASWGVAGLAEAGAIFSRWRVSRLEGMKSMDAAHEKSIAKWKAREERLHSIGKSANKLGWAAAGVQGLAEAGKYGGLLMGGGHGGGLLSRFFGGSGGREVAGNFDSITASLQGATSQGSAFGSVMTGVLGTVGKIALGIAGLGVATVGGLGYLLKQGVDLNSQLEQANAQFEIFTGSAGMAASMVKALKKEADITPFSTMEVIQSGAGLISLADKSQAKLMDLVKTAERLTVLNPDKANGGGLESAGIALKNALSGNYQSLQERFNIAPAQIEAIKAQGKSGLDLIKALLTSLNVGEHAVDKMGRTWTGLLSTVTSFVDTLKQNFAQPFFEWIKGKAELATAWIQTNGQWAMDVAKGLGTWVQEKITALSTVGGAARSWFNIVMNWVDLLPQKLAAAWQGSKFSAFFGELLQQAWNMAKEIGKLLFETFLLSSEIVGRKIYEAIPEALGGGGLRQDLKLLRSKGPLGEMAANRIEQTFADQDRKKWDDIFARTGNISAIGSQMGSTVSNFMGDTLGGRQAMANAGAGKMGILDTAAQVGSAPTAGELKDKVEQMKKQQDKLHSYSQGRESIFRAARERAQHAGAAPGSALDIMYYNQARVQADALQQQMFGAEAAAAQPQANVGDPKLAKKAEANNAKAQMRPRNMSIGIAVTSLDGHLHGAYATAG